jgi:hypothetical protein
MRSSLNPSLKLISSSLDSPQRVHYFGTKILTLLSEIFNNLKLMDGGAVSRGAHLQAGRTYEEGKKIN